MPSAPASRRTFAWYLRRLLAIVLALVVGLVVTIVLIGTFAHGPGSARLATGQRRNEARYLVMRDGVRIAVDLWFPPSLTATTRAPTLIHSTRYVRAMRYGMLGRALATLGQAQWVQPEIDRLNQAGYIVMLVDARGSGASFGTRAAEWSPDEVADMGEIVDWIVAESWSNGRVGGWGVSYEGNTAELLAATGRPAVKAVAPLFDDYDPVFTQALAGGAFGRPFIAAWGAGNKALDASDICGASGVSGAACFFQNLVAPGTKPVDGDSGLALLAAAVAGHRANYSVEEFAAAITYPRDSVLPDGRPNLMIAPYLRRIRAAAESNHVAMLVRLGWYDGGTVNTGLGRFFTQTNPMQIEIGAWSHGGGHDVDPFAAKDTPPNPASRDQFTALVKFFDAYLKGDGTPAVDRLIHYYTMNQGLWKTTPVWPPAEMATRRWYFAPGHGLVPDAAPADSGADVYQVDFSATTGHPGRWDTQLGGGDVVYADRAAADRTLLSYTGTPLPIDVEITGAAVINLEVSSTATDGLFFGYLEDVAPDGRVTYLTEGLLRALHRKVSAAPPPYHEFGPVHSFTSADGAPMIPGQPTTVSFALYSVSVRLGAGHRIRVSIAGHDEAGFDRVPRNGTPTITVFRGKTRASWIDLPMRAVH